MPPSGAAPAANVPAPINVSTIGQWKTGGLIVGSSFSSLGKAMMIGNVSVGGYLAGVGTTNPADLQVSGHTIIGGNPNTPGCSALTCLTKIYYDGAHNLIDSTTDLLVNYYSGKNIMFGQNGVKKANATVSLGATVESLMHPSGLGNMTVCASTNGTLYLCSGNTGLTLTQLSPNSKPAGAPPFELDIYGTNFTQTTVFKFEGATLDTTWINSTQARVYYAPPGSPGVPAALVAVEGVYQVQAFDTVGGVPVSSNQLPFTVQDHGARIYYKNGTYTGTGCNSICTGSAWTAPSGVNQAHFYMWSAGGGGGRGGSGNTTGYNGGYGGGGGGGGAFRDFVYNVTPGTSYTMVVGQGGAGGQGGLTTSQAGSQGGSTFVKQGTAILTCNGGQCVVTGGYGGQATPYSGNPNGSTGGTGAIMSAGYSGGSGSQGGNGGNCFGGEGGEGGFGGSMSLPGVSWNNHGGKGGHGGYADGAVAINCTAAGYNAGFSDGFSGADGLIYVKW